MGGRFSSALGASDPRQENRPHGPKTAPASGGPSPTTAPPAHLDQERRKHPLSFHFLGRQTRSLRIDFKATLIHSRVKQDLRSRAAPWAGFACPSAPALRGASFTQAVLRAVGRSPRWHRRDPRARGAGPALACGTSGPEK